MSTSARLESLDVFRGITVAAMILVNNPGDWTAVYPPLLHADWNGCTLADYVFPFFIFIVGVATTFAFSRRRQAGHDRVQLYQRIMRRAVLLITLGVVLNIVEVAPAIGGLRLPGVLQRIGLVYLCTAAIVLHTGVRARVVVVAVLLAAHWALLTLVPFGGHPAGTVLPGANLSAFIDRGIFGRHTLTPTGDPEGLLGTMPAIATALLGELAGAWLRSTASAARRIAGLAIGGALLVAAGFLWSAALPFNKPLWTGSYVLLTGGAAAIALCACYALVDVARVRTWAAPFLWLGINPLAIYFLSEFVGHVMERTIKWRLFWGGFVPLLQPALSDRSVSLAMGLCTVAVWTGVAGLFYARGVRIQV